MIFWRDEMNANLAGVNHEERLLNAAEVAEYLNVSRAMAYNLMKKGEIKTVAIRAARRVRPEDLRRYIEENIQISAN